MLAPSSTEVIFSFEPEDSLGVYEISDGYASYAVLNSSFIPHTLFRPGSHKITGVLRESGEVGTIVVYASMFLEYQ